MVHGMLWWVPGKCESGKCVLKYNIWKDNKRSNITFTTVLLQNRFDPKKHQQVVQLKETRFVLNGLNWSSHASAC